MELLYASNSRGSEPTSVPRQETGGGPHLLRNTVTDPKNIAFVLAIYLYFSGFLFAHYFYRHFGLASSVDGLPFYHMFVFSFNVIRENWLITAWMIALLLACASYSIVKTKTPLLDGILLILFLGLLPALFLASHKSAYRAALGVRSGDIPLPVITLVFKPATEQQYAKMETLLNANTDGALRLLSHNSEYYFVLHQDVVPGIKSLPAAHVFHVPKDDLVLGYTTIYATP